MTAEKTAPEQRGRPFPKGRSGNPKGRPKGSRHVALRALDGIGQDHAEALVRKAIELAMGGDTTALSLLLRRVWPEPKGRVVEIELQELRSPADLPHVLASIVRAAAHGAITPDEAAALSSVVENHRRAVETADHERRLAALESQQPQEDRNPWRTG